MNEEAIKERGRCIELLATAISFVKRKDDGNRHLSFEALAAFLEIIKNEIETPKPNRRPDFDLDEIAEAEEIMEEMK